MQGNCQSQDVLAKDYLVSFPSKKSLNFLVVVIFSRENQPNKSLRSFNHWGSKRSNRASKKKAFTVDLTILSPSVSLVNKITLLGSSFFLVGKPNTHKKQQQQQKQQNHENPTEH